MPANATTLKVLLGRLPLFKDLCDSSLELLSAQSIVASYDAREVLFEAGDDPDYLHVLVEGAVQLTTGKLDGRESVVELLQPVDAFIMAAVLTSQPLLMTAKTVEPSRLVLIPGPVLRDLVASEPRLALTMLGSLANQYRRMVRQIKDLRLRTTSQRFGMYLLNLLDREAGEADRVVLPFDKKLLAARLHMTPESLSRAIVAVRQHGVDIEMDEVLFVDAEALRRFCHLDHVLDRIDEALDTLTVKR